jgi:hypothetical protein
MTPSVFDYNATTNFLLINSPKVVFTRTTRQLTNIQSFTPGPGAYAIAKHKKQGPKYVIGMKK